MTTPTDEDLRKCLAPFFYAGVVPGFGIPVARGILARFAPPPSGIDALRADGWRVAVHNDYMLGGELHTFWLVTKGERALKGEGRTDAEAIAQIVSRLATPMQIPKEGMDL